MWGGKLGEGGEWEVEADESCGVTTDLDYQVDMCRGLGETQEPVALCWEGIQCHGWEWEREMLLPKTLESCGTARRNGGWGDRQGETPPAPPGGVTIGRGWHLVIMRVAAAAITWHSAVEGWLLVPQETLFPVGLPSSKPDLITVQVKDA